MKEAKKLWSWLAIPCIALAVLTGSILPVLLVFMALIAADKHVMGAHRSGIVSRILIWVTVAIVTILTVALLVMQVLGI